MNENESKIPVEEFVDSLMSRNARPATPVKGFMPLPTTTGVVFEINEATFDHYLEAVPISVARLKCVAWFYLGRSKSLFARREARFYCRRLTAKERRQFWRADKRS